jgi:hypothetical protein
MIYCDEARSQRFVMLKYAEGENLQLFKNEDNIHAHRVLVAILQVVLLKKGMNEDIKIASKNSRWKIFNLVNGKFRI